jgi:hypothetical protein
MLFRRALRQRYNYIDEIVSSIIENSDLSEESTVISYLQIRLREIEADMSTKRRSSLSIDHHLDELEAIITRLAGSNIRNLHSYRSTRVAVGA